MDSVTYKPWIKRGEMLYNTECLSPNDPDHVYNQIKAQGLHPEDFGIEHPLTHMFKDKSREDLIAEVLDLRRQLTSIYAHGMDR